MCKVKIFAALLFLTFANLLNGAAPAVRLTLLPSDPEKESIVKVDIAIDLPGGTMSSPSLSLPALKGGRWLNNFNEQRFSSGNVNGQITNRLIIVKRIRTAKDDYLEIPPVKIKVGDKEVSSSSLKIRLREKSAAPPENAAKNMILRLKLSPSRQLCVGESCELQMELLIPPDMAVTNIAALPSISGIQDAILLNVPGGSSADPRFRISDTYVRRVGGVNYRAAAFNTRIKFLKSGKFSISAALPVIVAEREKESQQGVFDDPFFQSFFSRPRQKQVTVKSEVLSVTIQPLPPLPAGCINSGLAGQWTLSAVLKPEKCRAGDVAELIITAGSDTEIPDSSVTVPELKFENIRVYPPEKKVENGRLVFRYVLVPMRAGSLDLPLKLAVLDPENRRYNVTDFNLKLAVSPGDKAPPSAPAVTPDAEPADRAEREAATLNNGLNYQKSRLDETVKVPLILNSAIMIAILLTLSLLLALGAVFYRKATPEEKIERDERRKLKRRLENLLGELKKSDDLQKVMLDNGVADIAIALGLPGGATAQDIADTLTDEEMKEFFNALARTTFIPAARQEQYSSGVKKKLCAFVKKLTVVLFAAAALFAVELNAGNEDINRDFNSGNFQKAAEFYRSKLSKNGGVSPAALYNLASAEYYLGNLPEARLCLMRASLLDPGDGAIRANLRFVEDKLHIAPAADTPGQYLVSLRDRLRPDSHLLCAAAALAVIALILFLRRRMARSLRWSGAGAAMVIIVLALVSVATQMNGRYSDKNLILTAKSTEVRSLPAENGGETVCRLSGGCDALLLESAGQWYHIRANGYEGWVRKSDAEIVFPYGLF